MAKAFSEQEKQEIRKKIMETALDLFHDKGVKSISIQEITQRVGIAQGSFYTFWKDKDTLIIDLIFYRSTQKLTLLEKKFPSSLENPANFLTNIIYDYSTDLMNKIETQETYRDAFKIFYKRDHKIIEHVKDLYIEFIKNLVSYWKEHNVIKTADEYGLSNAFIGAFALCFNSRHFDTKYFKQILKTYICSVVSSYIEK